MIQVVVIQSMCLQPTLELVFDELVKIPELLHKDILPWIGKIGSIFGGVPVDEVVPAF